MSEYIIETARLGLRKWIDNDIPQFITMNEDRQVMEYFPAVLTALETAAMVKRIRLHFDNKGYGLYAVDDLRAKQFIGFTGFSTPVFQDFFTPCVEIGWRFKATAWGQGFATEAAAACLQYGFTTLQLQKIVSFTAVTNLKSENVMKRIGMKKTGSFEHPNIDKNSPLCQHVLYEKEAS